MFDLFSHQAIARETLVGMGLEALGVCYLAYDLLGGKHGPLRIMARIAGYIPLFFTGYVIVLGLRYALIAAVGMGITLVIELHRMGAHNDRPPPSRTAVSAFGFMRGVVLGIAGMTFAGFSFGAVFGLLSGAGLALCYSFGLAPSDDYVPDARPRMTAHKIVATISRTVVVTMAGIVAALFNPSAGNWIELGLRLGLAAGIVSAVVGLFSSSIEWWIEQIPDRKLGVAGLGLIFIGMALQSIQYWAVVFGVPIQ